ncbi:MAG: cation diffusion facilitator family transporter [Phycisphaerae bacterium]
MPGSYRLFGEKFPDARYAWCVDEFQSQGRRVSRISLGLNGGLALVKLVTGIVGHSYALIADAIESLGDIFSSAIVWGGLVIASRPADENHPYGHGKAEPLAALAVAVMLIGAAIVIATQAIHGTRVPQEAPAAYTLVVLLAVVVVKEAMCRYELRTAKRIGSTAITVDAWHHRSDALTSTAAAIGITIALVGGEGYESADDWAALAACLVIVINGLRFARIAVGELMDTTPDTALADEIQVIASGVEGARFVEKVLVRKAGPALYVDLHLEVDPALTVREAHGIAHAVKDAIKSRRAEVADVLVHVEPHVERA